MLQMNVKVMQIANKDWNVVTHVEFQDVDSNVCNQLLVRLESREIEEIRMVDNNPMGTGHQKDVLKTSLRRQRL